MREYTTFIQQEISSVTSIAADTLDLETPFSGFGIDSLQAVTIAANLSKKLNRELPLTVFFDYPNIRSLADYLAGKSEIATLNHHGGSKQAPMAIIGLACRFPGAKNAEEFWQNLTQGKDCIREVPSSRWDYNKYSELPALRWGGFLEDIEGFDSEMFGISEAEASHMDPQQKILLECVHEALENAGITPAELHRSDTGVFVGISSSDFSSQKIREGKEANVLDAIGNSHSIASNRISYIYNLRGPSLSIDTACSSSLVALHKACQSIESGECSLAIVAGVNILLDPQISVAFANAGMLAPDGHCKTFSQEANGYVRGEGVGAIILQKASEAKQEKIYAIVAGTAVNHDGKTNGLTAPSGPAQEEVIRSALQRAGLAAEKISFIEAHGTGTSLGDPIEFLSLAKIFPHREGRSKVSVGSAKAFIGHLEAAAGIAGIIKVALSLRQREWVRQIQFTEINPKMKSALQELEVITKSVRMPDDQIVAAGVSSFGFGGTNAHAVLESAPRFKAMEKKQTNELLFLSISATNKASLKVAVERWRKSLPLLSEAAILRSNHERLEYRERITFYGENKSELIQAIAQWQAGIAGAWLQQEFPKAHQARVVFSFSNEGASLVKAAFELAAVDSIFLNYWQECLAYFDGFFPLALGVPWEAEQSVSKCYRDSMLFSARYSFTKFLLERLGVLPEMILLDKECELAIGAALNQISLAEASRKVMRGEHEFALLNENKATSILSASQDKNLLNLQEEAKKSGLNYFLSFDTAADWRRAFAKLAIRKCYHIKIQEDNSPLPSTPFFHKNQINKGLRELTMDNALLSELQLLVADLLHVSPAEVDPDTNLIDLGADSLLLLSAIQTIKERHGVSIAVADLFRNLNTLRAICTYVIENKPKPAAPVTIVEAKPAVTQQEQETRKVVAAMNMEAVKSTIHVRGDLQGIIESQLALT